MRAEIPLALLLLGVAAPTLGQEATTTCSRVYNTTYCNTTEARQTSGLDDFANGFEQSYERGLEMRRRRAQFRQEQEQLAQQQAVADEQRKLAQQQAEIDRQRQQLGLAQQGPQTAASAAAPFAIACHLEAVAPVSNGQRVVLDPSFLIDPLASTVSGLPASISVNQIQWTEPTSKTRFVVDRITGGAGVTLISDGLLLMTGNCAAAATRKF